MKVGDKVKHIPTGTVGIVTYVVGDKVALDSGKAFVGADKFEVIEQAESIAAEKAKADEAAKKKHEEEQSKLHPFLRKQTTDYKDIREYLADKIDYILQNKTEHGADVPAEGLSEVTNGITKDQKTQDKENKTPNFIPDAALRKSTWDSMLAKLSVGSDFEDLMTAKESKDESYAKNLIEEDEYDLQETELSKSQINYFTKAFVRADITVEITYKYAGLEKKIVYENGKFLSAGKAETKVRLPVEALVLRTIREKIAPNPELVARLIDKDDHVIIESASELLIERAGEDADVEKIDNKLSALVNEFKSYFSVNSISWDIIVKVDGARYVSSN